MYGYTYIHLAQAEDSLMDFIKPTHVNIDTWQDSENKLRFRNNRKQRNKNIIFHGDKKVVYLGIF